MANVIQEFAAGQTRHFAGAVGGAMLVLAMPPETVQAIQVLLDQAGVDPTIQTGLGGALVLGASIASWRHKLAAARNQEETTE